MTQIRLGNRPPLQKTTNEKTAKQILHFMKSYKQLKISTIFYQIEVFKSCSSPNSYADQFYKKLTNE